MISILAEDKNGNVLARAQGETEALLCVERVYEPGDRIVFSGSRHLFVKPDLAVRESEVYLPGETMTWTVPCGEHRLAYCPGAFEQKRHILSARAMTEEEVRSRRNIAADPADLRGDTDFFPHCTANVETRGESCFAARNVIDGLRYNTGHGEWPFGSWGIGAREDAWCMLDFGRPVDTESLTLVLRADFPHDAYWTGGHAVFSDGSEIAFTLEKTGERQRIPCVRHGIRWIRLERLIKSDDPSAFPALRQIEVTGRDSL